MKSIRSKILTVVLSSVLATTVLLLVISVASISILNRNDSDLLLEYIVGENASLINGSLESMEQSVSSIGYYALEQLGSERDTLERDLAWRTEYISKIESFALTEARDTHDVAAVYYRLAQHLGEPSGFLYQYYEGTGQLEKRILTDISRYDRNDMEHVGWYYLPKTAERALWIGPYDNYNLKMRMISYEVPIMYNGEFIGVVGMDVNNLKTINDSIGHEKGDMLLKHCAQCMRKIFVGFPLYRIGGDEFCSIINNSIEPDLLIARLQEAAAEMSAQDFDTFKVSYQIAAGSAVYDRGTDTSFHDVFNRADQAMYENKKKIKGEA